MSGKRSVALTALMVVLAAVVGAASALVAQSARQGRQQPAAAHPTPYLVNRPSYNDALKACGYKGPTEPDGPSTQCMANKYNYVYSGTKTIVGAVETTSSSGKEGLADRIEALQAEVVDLEQQLNVKTQEVSRLSDRLGGLEQTESATNASAQLQNLQLEVQALQKRQAELCSSVVQQIGTLYSVSVCQ